MAVNMVDNGLCSKKESAVFCPNLINISVQIEIKRYVKSWDHFLLMEPYFLKPFICMHLND